MTERGKLQYKPRAGSMIDRSAASEHRTWDVRLNRSRYSSHTARHSRIPNCRRRGNSTSVQSLEHVLPRTPTRNRDCRESARTSARHESLHPKSTTPVEPKPYSPGTH